MIFDVSGVGFRYDRDPVLDNVTVSFCEPQLVAIAGPNGAGKSTLISILAGLFPHFDGTCLYRNRPVQQWPRRELAREVSFVPQSLRLEFPFTAEQVVWMGRTPYCAGLFESPEDAAEVDRALQLTDAAAFRARDFRSLSGGERQRVVLAAALAQSPRVLLLDEPTTFLDLKHQIAIYHLLRELARQGILVITVTHDLNLASTYADRIILLKDGRLVADAAPDSVLAPENLRNVFEIEPIVQAGPHGRPWIFYGN